ncbi:MAG: ribonuclease P protein component [bacterium]
MTVDSGGRILRRERLNKADDIRSLRGRGQRSRGSFVTLYVEPADAYQFGVIANRRVGIAARRNRARRVIREALRSLRTRLRDDQPVRILLAAKASAAHANTHDVAKELAMLLDTHGLLA